MSVPSARVFRLSRASYFAVVFVAFGVTPFVRSWSLALVYLVPLAVACYIARTATFVDDSGIAIRAFLGERRLPWAQIRGLSITGRSVYAVLADGSIRLPCVRQTDLSAIAAASGDHLPDLPAPTPKYAPGRRTRR
jgi:Bacterial PH domain